MPIDLRVLLAVRRSTLREGLERLSLPPPPSKAGTVQNWRLAPGKVWPLDDSDKTADLLAFVASDGHLGSADKFPDVYADAEFDDLPNQNLQGVRLSFNGGFQNLYHPDLDIALLQVYGDWASRGISSLFLSAKRPAFFHTLRLSDLVFGQESSLEMVADWRRYYEGETTNAQLCTTQPFDRRDAFGTSIRFGKAARGQCVCQVGVTGTDLRPLPPAQMYSYEYKDGNISVVLEHDSTAAELWDGPTNIRTPDEDSDAYDLSMANLEQGLGLPRVIACP